MQRELRTRTTLFFVIIVVSGFSADAAEIRLRSQAWPRGTVVRLGDVAEIAGEDAQQTAMLAAVPLMPAPTKLRVVDRHEIATALMLQLGDVSQYQLTGAARVQVHPVANDQPQPSHESAQLVYQATERLATTIAGYVQQQLGTAVRCRINTTLDAAQAAAVASDRAELNISGGTPPWLGQQRFSVDVRSPWAAERLIVEAEIATPTMVVAAAVPLMRGQIVRAEHVQLVAVDQPAGRSALTRIEDVVGKEVVRPVSAGQPLDEASLRRPLLVRRGEQVTVYAIASGVRVRTTATALDDGAEGDLVTVQTLDRQDRFVARVSGFRKVEVYASPPRAE